MGQNSGGRCWSWGRNRFSRAAGNRPPGACRLAFRSWDGGKGQGSSPFCRKQAPPAGLRGQHRGWPKAPRGSQRFSSCNWLSSRASSAWPRGPPPPPPPPKEKPECLFCCGGAHPLHSIRDDVPANAAEDGRASVGLTGNGIRVGCHHQNNQPELETLWGAKFWPFGSDFEDLPACYRSDCYRSDRCLNLLPIAQRTVIPVGLVSPP